MQAALDSLSRLNEFITNWKSQSLRPHSLKNYHTPAKYKLIYSAHYNNFFPTSKPLRLWTWKPLEEALSESVFCVSSDDHRHCFLCCCNVFGRIISPQSGISFTRLTGFPLVMCVSCGSRRSGNTVLSFFIYMTTSILYQASLGLSVD